MNALTIRCASAAVLAAALLAVRAAGAAKIEPLTAGVAVVDITPPTGYRMSGYFHERLATGTSNPLKAKAIVLRQGDRRAAMVFCDVIGLSLDVSSRARKRAAKATGIPAANILIAATHTHTGPLYHGALRKQFHDLAVAKHGEDPQEKVDYPAKLVAAIVRAVTTAAGQMREVRVESGTAKQEGLSFNRRFHMKTGPVRFNPGVGNPDIVRVAGPIDPQVGIVVFRGAKAGIVNFALHLDTVGGTKYAADYPYYVERCLQGSLGRDFVLLFGTGACGDINHIDVTKKERLKTEQIGTTLGRTVAGALDKLKTAAVADLAVRREIVKVPLQRYSPARIARARQDAAKIPAGELPFLKRVEAYKILSLQLRGGDTIGLEVQVIRLSRDAAIVGLPGEVFVDLALAIKRGSPFATTLVIELCQDSPGYIPTRKAFAEGSYETINSRIAPGGGERMADAAVRLLKGLAAKSE